MSEEKTPYQPTGDIPSMEQSKQWWQESPEPFFELWSWLVVLVFNQLYLARQLGQALHRPWESTDRPVTPQQVRRVMPAILLQVGTPARPCQPRGKSPGRAKGFRPDPAPRFPVVRKTLKVPLKASG